MILSITTEYGSQADVEIDIGSLQLDKPEDQAKLAAAVKNAMEFALDADGELDDDEKKFRKDVNSIPDHD